MPKPTTLEIMLHKRSQMQKLAQDICDLANAELSTVSFDVDCAPVREWGKPEKQIVVVSLDLHNADKPIKDAYDPVFIGDALYIKTEDGGTVKTSKVVGIVKHAKLHPLQIETLNTIYTVACTSSEASYCIRQQLKEKGFTK